MTGLGSGRGDPIWEARWSGWGGETETGRGGVSGDIWGWEIRVRNETRMDGRYTWSAMAKGRQDYGEADRIEGCGMRSR